MQLIAVMLASLFRTAGLRVPDRMIVHFDVALLAVVTCVQARALQEPHGAEGRESCIFALCSLVKPSPLRRISASSPEPMPRRRAHSRASSATFPSTGGWLWPSRASRAWRGSRSRGSRTDLGHLRFLLFGSLYGYDEGVAEAFCTVSLRGQVHKGKESLPRSRSMIRERA